MKSALAIVAATVGCAVMLPAHAADSGFYVGAGVGASQLAEKNGGVDTGLAAQGIGSASSIKKNATTFGLNLGYQFTPNWAVEGGYTDLGSHDINGTVSSPASDGLSGKVKARMWNVAAVGTLPLEGGFGVYAKLGVARTDTKVDIASTTGATTPLDTKDDRWSPLIGVGALYRINENLDATVEYNRIDRLGSDNSTGRFDANTVMAGLRYRF
jgi:OOP family OmpA-OmpF porin